MIRIICTQDGFRRGGVSHPKGKTEYPDNTFSPEQLGVMRKEPKLTVEIIDQGASLIEQAEAMTMAQLSAAIIGRGHTVPPGLKKADLVALYAVTTDQEQE